ncbi:hypothetical protein, variant [Blastomyces dermatitidis ATCC 18188]|uniref:Uncharacterized protein n=1 Tax=Ajellomyces dermatitidis (strain ATCC 18188 / CBS 674.68) TaxID=653446 RepID=F2TLU6_AJEDA|nr:hypothetical protein BDDG_07154 [Blastomyces dermatitidis ATCC 18188]KMW68304.1 hypothetical protein, variant [Blastomyces dermatitidis ATCC 18188]
MKIISPTVLLPLLSTSYLITHATARKNGNDAFNGIHTGCCPSEPEFQQAISHPNATGALPFVGLHLDDSALATLSNDRPPSTPPPKNWTWTTAVMEVPLGSSGNGEGNVSATNQIFTLNIPEDVDIYSPRHGRNVCVLLLKMVTVNQNDPGDCEHIFPRVTIERMREELVRRVGEMTPNKANSSPCAGMRGRTSWQEIITSYHRANTTLLTRKTPTAAQYRSTTNPHPATDYSPYDAALVRTQPIFLLGYSTDPEILAGPAILKMELAETRLTCVRVQKVLEGSRGAEMTSGGAMGRKGLLMGMRMGSNHERGDFGGVLVLLWGLLFFWWVI